MIKQTTKPTKVSCTKTETKGVRVGWKDFNHIAHSHKSEAFFNEKILETTSTLSLVSFKADGSF